MRKERDIGYRRHRCRCRVFRWSLRGGSSPKGTLRGLTISGSISLLPSRFFFSIGRVSDSSTISSRCPRVLLHTTVRSIFIRVTILQQIVTEWSRFSRSLLPSDVLLSLLAKLSSAESSVRSHRSLPGSVVGRSITARCACGKHFPKFIALLTL